MRRRRKGKLEPVEKVLRGVYPEPDQFDAAKAFSWWGRSVPKRIVDHARPVKLIHGVLIVHVSSSVWANELHYLSADLLAELRKHAPHSGVKQLRFKVGPLPDLPNRRPAVRPAPDPVRLAALPEALGRALGQIQDDDLRKAIAKAATTSLARNRHKPE
ncbi:MAG: DUF721 domain-containing protein [Polyangiales bacterium]